MKVTLLTAIFVVALHGHAVADDKSTAVEIAANDLSYEMTQCFAFHNIVAACMLRSNQKEPSERARKGAAIFLDYAVWLEKQAGISKIPEVLEARANMARKNLFKLIDSDCRNISIAMDKYLDRCQALAENPAAALTEYIAQAEQRMPKKGSAVR
jgi:hypothetical protein